MQPMGLCICTGRQFEDTFENSLWRKAYKCNQCDFASVQADNLRRQLKERTSATICNFASIQAGDLRKHLKTPSGEKSFKCNQCDFPSVQTGDLRKHLKTPSGEKV